MIAERNGIQYTKNIALHLILYAFKDRLSQEQSFMLLSVQSLFKNSFFSNFVTCIGDSLEFFFLPLKFCCYMTLKNVHTKLHPGPSQHTQEELGDPHHICLSLELQDQTICVQLSFLLQVTSFRTYTILLYRQININCYQLRLYFYF